MEMTMNMGAFEALDMNELMVVDGGDKARQQMVAAHRASGKSLGSTKTAVNAQATVTGWGLALVGVATAIPTGGTSLALAVVSLAFATAGIASL